MPTFYLTFAYSGPRRSNYQQIEAPDRATAREMAYKEYGPSWAFLYSEEEFADQARRYGLVALPDILVHESHPLAHPAPLIPDPADVEGG